MSKEHRWLATELERWTADGLITADQASRLRARYPVEPRDPAAPPWGVIVFFALGAVVVGLGVILLFAYNWSAIPKAGKLALVFGAIAAAHGAGVTLRARDDWRSMLGEGTLLLGTMLFGAGIWLVAQIYHIDEHFPTGFLVWGLGALALAWAIPSIPQAIVATLVLAIWGSVEVLDFGNSVDWAVLILAGGVGSLAWRLRSALLAAIVLAAVHVQVLAHAAHWGGAGTAFTAAVAVSVTLLGLAELTRDASGAARISRVLRFFGLCGFLICAYVLTFAEAAEDVLRAAVRHRDGALMAALYRWTLFGAGLVAWAIVFARKIRMQLGPGPTEHWFYPLGLVCVIAGSTWGVYEDGALVAVVFNLIVLGLAALWIVQGCREARLRDVVIGSVLLGMLVFARYFDLFDSLAARGLAFVLFGAALFAEGFFYRAMRRGRAGAERGSP